MLKLFARINSVGQVHLYAYNLYSADFVLVLGFYEIKTAVLELYLYLYSCTRVILVLAGCTCTVLVRGPCTRPKKLYSVIFVFLRTTTHQNTPTNIFSRAPPLSLQHHGRGRVPGGAEVTLSIRLLLEHPRAALVTCCTTSSLLSSSLLLSSSSPP